MAQKCKLFMGIALFVTVFSMLSFGVGAQGATLSLSPASGSFGIGDEFSVAVRLHTGGASINAAEATINFPSDLLKVTSLSKSGSIFSLWTVEPTFSGSGIITFGGGTPGTFSGSSGTLVTINFKAKKEGEAQVTFSSARILAADGQGTNIFGGASGASYEISAGVERARPTPEVEAPEIFPSRPPAKPKIISLTHPDEEAWYSNINPEFSWALPKDATAVSFLLDRIPKRDPDSRFEGLLDSKLYSDVEEGVKYFHLKVNNAYGWSQISHYRVQIDSEPPHPFEITVLDGKETTNPEPAILFDATDSLSGIGYYEVKVGEGQKAEAGKSGGNPFKIGRQIPGTYTIYVKAFDKAGNFSQAITEVIIKPIETPVVIEFTPDLFIGEMLEVKGTGIPQGTVEVHVSQNKKGTSDTNTTTVDEGGNWAASSDRFFISGPYSFYVVQVDLRGARSMPSESFDFRVQAFVNIGPWRISSFAIALTLGLLFGISMLGGFLIRKKIQRIRRGVRYEASDAKKKLHRSVDRLKEQIAKRLKELERARREGKFSNKEAAVEQKLKNDLDKLELSIKKEIKDIEGGANHIDRPRRPRLLDRTSRWGKKIRDFFSK